MGESTTATCAQDHTQDYTLQSSNVTHLTKEGRGTVEEGELVPSFLGGILRVFLPSRRIATRDWLRTSFTSFHYPGLPLETLRCTRWEGNRRPKATWIVSSAEVYKRTCLSGEACGIRIIKFTESAVGFRHFEKRHKLACVVVRNGGSSANLERG